MPAYAYLPAYNHPHPNTPYHPHVRSTAIPLSEGYGKLSKELEAWKDKEDPISVVAVKENPTASQLGVKQRLSETLQLDAALELQSLPHSVTVRKLPVQISLKETLLNEQSVDTKADIVCIIDVSGSMAGAKLDNVKATIKLLLELMVGSRLAIVLFATSARVWMNFKTVNSDSTPKIIKVVDAIVDRDSTNITAGLHSAQTLLGNRSYKSPVCSLFLLSDGQHNQGPIDDQTLFGKDFERTKTEYSLHTFGYGDDHDARQMQSMAERKGGNYYFVQDIKKVDECFLDCLGMVSTMLANRGKAVIKLQPSSLYPEIRIVNTFGRYLTKISDTEAVLEIPTFYAGMRKDFLFEVEFEPTKKILTQHQLLEFLKIELEYFEIGNPSATKQLQSASVKALPPQSSENVMKNLDVTKNYLRVRTADSLDKVENLQNQGKHKEAFALLQALEQSLSSELGLQEDPLIVSLKAQVSLISKMVQNDSIGVANSFKTQNYVAQQRNVYMNQQSSPQFSQEMYANSRQTANFNLARSRKS